MPKKPIFPGTFLSYGEEYLPGKNAFESSDGNIYSSAVGIAKFDDAQKVVSVEGGSKDVEMIDIGTTVFGKVGMMTDSKVFVDIIFAQNNGKDRIIQGTTSVLMVFNVKNEYVKFLSEMFKVGDLVKAKVSSVSRFTIDLETKSDDSLGVVKAYCSGCREPVRMFGNGFKCPSCTLIAQRKFSTEYLLKN